MGLTGSGGVAHFSPSSGEGFIRADATVCKRSLMPEVADGLPFRSGNEEQHAQPQQSKVKRQDSIVKLEDWVINQKMRQSGGNLNSPQRYEIITKIFYWSCRYLIGLYALSFVK